MKPRLLFVSYTSEWTGPSNSLLHLATSLQGAFDTTVLLPEGGTFRSVLDGRGIPTVTFPSITKRFLGSFIRLIGRGRYDLVYANTPDGTSRLAFLAARAAGAKYVCHVRALGWNSNWFQLGHLRFADAVIAVSRSAADSVSRFVPTSRLHVVYNGIDLEGAREHSHAVDLRDLAGWSQDSLVFLGLANVCRRKGQAHAVAAMERLRSSVPEARLALLGRLDREPAYAFDVEDMVRRSGLGDRVRLLGFREDGTSLLSQADVLVHTALADPHPRAILEAMAAEVPVVAFDVDGVGETVVHERTGLLVEPADVQALAAALERLARDPELRSALGHAGRARAEAEFTDRATAAGVIEVIHDVLDATQ